MKRLVALFEAIDTTTSTNNKITALADYFRIAPPRDAIWTLYYFLGRKQKRLVKRKVIQTAIQELSGLPDWLFEESYSAVGDLAETIALLTETLAGKAFVELPLHQWIEERLPLLTKVKDDEQKIILQNWWRELPTTDVFILNKLLTGGFRSGVSARLVVRGLAQAFQWDEAIISEKLIGEWPVTEAWFLGLGSAEREGLSLYPYPFCLASPTDADPAELGSISDFAVEWKWDGIRAQIVKRHNQLAIWSRGEELVTQSFPELLALGEYLGDGTVLDGEILPFADEKVRAFADLQKRLQRKKVSEKMVREHPVVFLAFDCLEVGGIDQRDQPLSKRRQELDAIVGALNLPTLQSSGLIDRHSWEELAAIRMESRIRGVEGLMLKRWSSLYQMGRRKGDWWKWKIDPMTLDAVMLYAQAGHGKRANLYTDYTFGLWKEGQLVPFAKAYSGLTHDEIVKLDGWIRKNTKERFGPVRSVEAQKVFEIAFEGIQVSPRHKAGIAVRFPRILRERSDKKPEDADSLGTAMELLNAPPEKT